MTVASKTKDMMEDGYKRTFLKNIRTRHVWSIGFFWICGPKHEALLQITSQEDSTDRKGLIQSSFMWICPSLDPLTFLPLTHQKEKKKRRYSAFLCHPSADLEFSLLFLFFSPHQPTHLPLNFCEDTHAHWIRTSRYKYESTLCFLLIVCTNSSHMYFPTESLLESNKGWTAASVYKTSG